MTFDPYAIIWDELGEWLRGYQQRWYADPSRRKLGLKPRQVGFTDASGLSVVVACAGIEDPDESASCSWVSKDGEAAKESIQKCWKWVEFLREDRRLRETVLEYDAKTRPGTALSCSFLTYGKRRKIVAEAPTPNAGRSRTGHLVLDEIAWYPRRFQEQIYSGAMGILASNPKLRAWILSTPNGAGDLFDRLVHDRARFPEWSLHEVTLDQAIADGFPITHEMARALCATEEMYQQEFLLTFLRAAGQYIGKGLIDSSSVPMPPLAECTLLALGIDVASVTDLTAAVGLYRHNPTGLMILGDVYAINGLEYKSRPGRPGQDRVLDALIRHLKPQIVIMDATGDGRELFGYLKSRNPDCPLIPHVVDSDGGRGSKWKKLWVPRIRGDLEGGVLALKEDSRTRMYDKAVGPQVLREDVTPDAETCAAVVEDCFTRQPFRMLQNDFLKVRRVMAKHGLSYETERDAKTGHGDSFWASLFALYAVHAGALGSLTVAESLDRGPSMAMSEPEFVDYLRGKL